MTNTNTLRNLGGSSWLRGKDSYALESQARPPWEHPAGSGKGACDHITDPTYKNSLGTLRHAVVLCTNDHLGTGTGVGMYGVRVEVVSEG